MQGIFSRKNAGGNPNSNKLNGALVLFMLMQPLLDNFYLFQDVRLRVLGLTLPTLLRCIFILAAFAWVYIFHASRRERLIITLYLAFSLLYLLLHLWGNRVWRLSSLPDSYQIGTEIAYVLRLLLPILLYWLVRRNQLTEGHFRRVVDIALMLTLAMAILSNLTVSALSSYSNQPIRANIFAWFQPHPYAYHELSSKAWFNFANQLAAYILMLLPFQFHRLHTGKNWLPPLLIFFGGLALAMVGTRIASYGFLVLLAAATFLLLLSALRQKRTPKAWWLKMAFLALCLLAFTLILPYTPCRLRADATASHLRKKQIESRQAPTQVTSPDEQELIQNAQEKIRQGQVESLITHADIEEKKLLLSTLLKYSGIDPIYYQKSYPVEQDPDFWLRLLGQDAARRTNRSVQAAMLEAVKARNHAFGDSWVGIGYSREQAIYNLEKDFVNQYYSLGILGLLLFVSFYVYCPLRLLLRCLRQKPGCARLRVFYAATALAIFILAAWFSGNILDSLLMSTLFAFIAAASGVEEPRLQRTA